MNWKIFTAAASAALLAGGGQAAAAVISIDTFSTPQAVADDPFAEQPQGSEIVAGEALGGFRDLYVETDDDGNFAATTLEVSDGNLSFNNESGVTGRGWVTYDGGDGNPLTVDTDGLGGVDLEDGPGAGFFFEVVRLDLPFQVTIMAWDLSDMTTMFTAEVSATGDPFLPLAAFSNPDFDWNNVGALQFMADSNGTANVDATIGSISVETGVIPLPASALLLLGGLGGLSAFGMRRKRG
jgi:hypothetical protein